MNYVPLLLVCVLVVGCTSQSPAAPDTPPPSSRPPFLSDEEILKAVNENPSAILYFYSPTCSTCRAVEPMVEELQKKYSLTVIWVSKQENQAIFDQYKVKHYPAVYFNYGSEVLISFRETDSLDSIYTSVLDGTMKGMHKIEYTMEAEKLIIPSRDILPDTLYYLTYNDRRIQVYISPSAHLYVLYGAQDCYCNWLYLSKDLIFDGERHARWNKDTLYVLGGDCGVFIQLPFQVTGSSIVIDTKDIK